MINKNKKSSIFFRNSFQRFAYRPVFEGEVSRFNKLLEEYKKAPEVTRARLRIDMNQSVYSNSTKIMVDTEGGNNLLYLPLDKIMEQNKKSEED